MAGSSSPSAPLEVGVLGAGSFGTALSHVLLQGGHRVTLWCHEEGHADEINAAGRNTRYMKDFPLPGVLATASVEEAAKGRDLLLFVSPSQFTRAVARKAAAHVGADALVVSATKGIEQSGETMADVLAGELPAAKARMAFLSGPSFAREVLEGRPTAVVVAARDGGVAERVQRAFATKSFRVYSTDDVIGVELGGSVKNVTAIAAGVGDGLGLGHNARAAIITRGLAEMSRLGAAMGANPLTFMGLAGMGDLVLTCVGDLSRNRTVGLRLASGKSLDEVTASLGGQVAEGVYTARSVWSLAQRLGVEMPIVEAVYKVIYEGANPRDGVLELMTRPLKRERG
jgi:glycerol-3-phosphate dehydrogenase (NAD(P)+)